jgi:hypothetical protein
MAITTNIPQPISHGFAVNGTSADASSCEELVAAPGSGKAIVLQFLEISTVAAITVTIGTGESGDNVETVVIGPLNFAATSGSPVVMAFPQGLKLTANKSLTIDTSGAGAVQVFAQGYIE